MHALHDTPLRPTRFPREAAPACVATAVICCASCGGGADALVTRHLMKVSSLSRGVLVPLGSTPLRLLTRRLPLPPSSLTRSALGFPCGSLAQVGALRAYHVPSGSPCGEGLISTPGGHHLRPVRHEHRGVTPYLLVQASQHLALVLTHDASNDALPLTISHHPRALSALFFEVERLLCCLRE